MLIDVCFRCFKECFSSFVVFSSVIIVAVYVRVVVFKGRMFGSCSSFPFFAF